MKKIKHSLSFLCNILGINALGLAWIKWKTGGQYIRAVNYHGTPDAAKFEAQLVFFKKHFSDVSHADLQGFFKTKTWEKPKPGLLISFDDGLKNNYTIAKNLLEKHGFTGWFCIPSAIFTVPPAKMEAFMLKNRLGNSGNAIEVDPPMTKEEFLDLSKKHVIVSHTRHHHFVSEKDSTTLLENEIAGSKKDLENLCQQTVDTFCWVGGRTENYSTAAAQTIAKAGYQLGLMTCSAPVLPDTSPLQIHRTHVEDSFPLHFVRFSISGAYDLLYRKKRRLVNELTGSGIS